MEPKWRQNGAKIAPNRREMQGRPKGTLQGKLRKNVRKTWGQSKENLWDIQEIHGKTKGTFRKHPGKMQGQSRENLRKLQGNSKRTRGEIQGESTENSGKSA